MYFNFRALSQKDSLHKTSLCCVFFQNKSLSKLFHGWKMSWALGSLTLFWSRTLQRLCPQWRSQRRCRKWTAPVAGKPLRSLWTAELRIMTTLNRNLENYGDSFFWKRHKCSQHFAQVVHSMCFSFWLKIAKELCVPWDIELLANTIYEAFVNPSKTS